MQMILKRSVLSISFELFNCILNAIEKAQVIMKHVKKEEAEVHK